MKILERVAENALRKQVPVSDTQFGFMPGGSATDAIFIVSQLQEKFSAVSKTLCMAFVDLENAFHRVPRHVYWWVLCTLGVKKWLVHQGTCLSHLPFITVLEALSQEFRTRCP